MRTHWCPVSHPFNLCLHEAAFKVVAPVFGTNSSTFAAIRLFGNKIQIASSASLGLTDRGKSGLICTRNWGNNSKKSGWIRSPPPTRAGLEGRTCSGGILENMLAKWSSSWRCCICRRATCFRRSKSATIASRSDAIFARDASAHTDLQSGREAR